MSIAVNQKVYRCHIDRNTAFLSIIDSLLPFFTGHEATKKIWERGFFDKNGDCDNSDTASFYLCYAPKRESLTTLSAFA